MLGARFGIFGGCGQGCIERVLSEQPTPVDQWLLGEHGGTHLLNLFDRYDAEDSQKKHRVVEVGIPPGGKHLHRK